jgi:hypothetical protein
MKTYLTINYISGSRNEEFSVSFIRAVSAKRPTDIGAARMVASNLQSRGYDAKPSDISVTRIEECCYQTR